MARSADDMQLAQEAVGGALHVIMHILAAVFPMFLFGGCGGCPRCGDDTSETELQCDCTDVDVPSLSLTVTNTSNCSCADDTGGLANEPKTVICDGNKQWSWGATSGYEMDIGCGGGWFNLTLRTIIVCFNASSGSCASCTDFTCDTVGFHSSTPITKRRSGSAEGFNQTIVSCSLDPIEIIFDADFSSGTVNCGSGDDYTLRFTLTE